MPKSKFEELLEACIELIYECIESCVANFSIFGNSKMEYSLWVLLACLVISVIGKISSFYTFISVHEACLAIILNIALLTCNKITVESLDKLKSKIVRRR